MSELAGFEWLSLAGGRAALRLCNSYDRLCVIIELAGRMNDWDWLTLLGEEWESCDNIAHWLDALWDETPFGELAATPLIWRDAMMTEVERDALADFPETVTIYRGCYAHNKRGLSWTLDRDTAERFPKLQRYRAEGQPLLVRASIHCGQILALKLGRDETEVIAWRPKIQAISHIRATVA
jgi:hypothetical protein